MFGPNFLGCQILRVTCLCTKSLCGCFSLSNNIFEQLQSTQIRKVLKILDQTRSTYNAAFAKLCKEVFKSRAESNNNVRFLRYVEQQLGQQAKRKWKNGSLTVTPFCLLVFCCTYFDNK